VGLWEAVDGHATYQKLMERVGLYLGGDFPALSREAYWKERPRRYWAGGHEMNGKSHQAEFSGGNFWEMGWDIDADHAAGKRAWAKLRQIRQGDLFAVKGYGGQSLLVVYYVGEVVSVNLPEHRLQFKRIPR